MRLVIRSRDEMSEGEPCIDTCRTRGPLECQIIRERAAEVCSAMASMWAAAPDMPLSHFDVGGAPIGACPIVDLAFNAFMQAHCELEQRGIIGAPMYEVYAEAEALIRCGWEP